MWKWYSPCRSASIFTQVLYMSAYIQSTDDTRCKQYWQLKKADSSNLILLQRVDLILGPDPVRN